MPGAPSRYSSPCGAPSSLVHVTLSPGAIVISAGLNSKSTTETFAPSAAAPAARATDAASAKTVARRPIRKSFTIRSSSRVLQAVISVSFRRRGGLDDDLARRVAERDGPCCAAREIDDREIVRPFVGHVNGLAVGRGRRPVRLLADGD